MWKSNGLFWLIVMVISFFCCMIVQNNLCVHKCQRNWFTCRSLTREGNWYKLRRYFSTTCRGLSGHFCSLLILSPLIYYSEKQMCSPRVIGCPFSICFLAEPLINKGVGFTHHGGQAPA